MKKNIMSIAAVAALMIVSCVKENVNQENQINGGKTLSFSAAVSETITKGTYNGAAGGKGSFSWAANDKIGVILFSGTGYTGDGYNDWVAPFTYNSTTGEFDYSGEPTLPAGIHYGKVAFYPYGVASNPTSIYDETNYNISNGNLYVHLHKGRTYDANVQPLPVVAKFDDTEDPNPITLQHIAAGVQITLTNVPSSVTKVELSEVSDTPQYITGWFTYAVNNLGETGDNGISTPADDSERGSIATYNLTNPSSTVTMTFPVPPLTTPKFKVDVYEGNTLSYTITSRAQASLTKGQILVMPSLDIAPVYLYVKDEGLATKDGWGSSRTIYTANQDITEITSDVTGYHKFLLPYSSNGKYDIYYKGGNNCEVGIKDVSISMASKKYYYLVNGFEAKSVDDPSNPGTIALDNKIWIQNSYGSVSCHMWKPNTSITTTWPGTEMAVSTAKFYNVSLYYVELLEGATMCIFNNGDTIQTGEIALSPSTSLFYNVWKGNNNSINASLIEWNE